MEEVSVICPACGEEIFLDYLPEVGEVVYCTQCGRASEVIRTEPLTLQEVENGEDFLPEEEENLY